MDREKYQDLNNKFSGFELELKDIMSKLSTKINSLEQAMANLDETLDQFDNEMGFWDTVPNSLLV